MKNKFKTINKTAFHLIIGLLVFTTLFSSCKDEDDGGGPITINKVYLEDVNSTVPDREVTFARLGQLIRIEGSGFTGLKKIYINGFATYFNPVYVSDQSLLVTVSKNTPIVDADATVRNTIKLTNDSYEATFSIEIRDAAPTITQISNTLPLSGEEITVFGSGLLEVNKVVFPGNIEVTSGITSDVDGEFFTVTVPEGVSADGGSILIECANGGAYSPAFFNCKKSVILDFDGNGTQGFWGDAVSMIKDTDLESTPLGSGNVSQGNYVPHRPARIDTIKAATNRCSEVWTAGNDVDDWRGQLTDFIPTTTSVNDVAFQFDLFVPDAWANTGFLKICLVNAFNGGEWSGLSYNFVPWIVEGEVVPFQTNGWTTVTIPFSKFYAFADGNFTFEDILVSRETASYKNFGFYFENSNIKLSDVTGNDSDIEFTSKDTQIKVYTDNWRIVSLNTPVYSDFPEEE
ncbi:MAG: glycan-binding surface protein [Salinivirgaceae bacterium]